MKMEVVAYVALCDTCHKVKAEHQRPVGWLQPLKVPEWKWEEIGIDFIVGLPRTRFNMGYSGPFDKGCSLHTSAYHLYGGKAS
jgi:hypothetical protein